MPSISNIIGVLFWLLILCGAVIAYSLWIRHIARKRISSKPIIAAGVAGITAAVALLMTFTDERLGGWSITQRLAFAIGAALLAFTGALVQMWILPSAVKVRAELKAHDSAGIALTEWKSQESKPEKQGEEK